MTSGERRRLYFTIFFHVAAVLCVVWSLYVLIDRTAEEIRQEQLQWPFWTKLAVVAVGFTGGIVFMYIQCKVYINYCKKWKAYNRVILVQDAPEEVHRAKQAAAAAAAATTIGHASAGSSRKNSNTRAARANKDQPRAAASTDSTDNAGDTAAVGGAAGINARSVSVTGQKTNAETQTALKGTTLAQVMLRQGVSSTVGDGANDEDGEDEDGGVVSRIGDSAATIFFAECERSRGGMTAPPRRKSRATEIKDPVLICDLPGTSASAHGEGEEEQGVGKAANSARTEKERCDSLGGR